MDETAGVASIAELTVSVFNWLTGSINELADRI